MTHDDIVRDRVRRSDAAWLATLAQIRAAEAALQRAAALIRRSARPIGVERNGQMAAPIATPVRRLDLES